MTAFAKIAGGLVLLRARKVLETLPAKYSVVAFEGTGIVVNAIQAIARADLTQGIQVYPAGSIPLPQLQP